MMQTTETIIVNKNGFLGWRGSRWVQWMKARGRIIKSEDFREWKGTSLALADAVPEDLRQLGRISLAWSGGKNPIFQASEVTNS